MSAPAKLRLEAVALQLNGRQILSDVDLSFAQGDFIALVGPNGSGKTSLIKLCLGINPPGNGRVLLGEQSLAQVPPKQRAASLAWLPQRWEPSEPLPVLEVVAAARYRLSEPFAVAARAATAALGRVGAEE
ncbi:MAG: ABC transporter ATP-binding protein, partial [Myxococcales bacterium]|nr:ABC transporter ATP-binding protein [Myxococcales bacterium]